MDMETMLTRSKSFDFSCQLHRGGLTLTDEDKMIYQAITNTQKSCQSQVMERPSAIANNHRICTPHSLFSNPKVNMADTQVIVSRFEGWK